MPRSPKSKIRGLSITKIRNATDDPTIQKIMCRVRIPGTNKYKGKCFATRQEALAWGDLYLAKLKAGTEVVGNAHVDAIAAEYCHQLREVGGAELLDTEYIRHIEIVADGLVRAGIRDMKANTFAVNVRSWIANLKPNWWAAGRDRPWYCKTGGKPLTNVTRNRVLREIRCLCNHAVKTGRLMRHPLASVKPFKEEKRLKPTFTLDELRMMVSDEARNNMRQNRQELLDAITAAGGDRRAVATAKGVHLATVYNRLHAEHDHDDPWWLPACLMVYTGCRAQEAMHLRWQDIDWKSERVRVSLQDCYDQKTDSEREFPLQAELADILRPLAKPSGFIIEDEWLRTTGAITHAVRTVAPRHVYTPGLVRYLERIGINAGKEPHKRTAHSLRHAWVAMMLATGESPKLVAVWAGHGGEVQDRYAGAMSVYHREASGWSRGVIQLRTCAAVAMEATG
jgi:integrase